MTAPVTPVPIVAYSGSMPDPSDPTTYGTRGRAFWAWEVGPLYSGMNALGTATYTNAVAAAEAAESATMTAGALMWNAATNYTTGQGAISPTDMQTYRRNSPGGVDATDPASSANWTLVGDRFLKKSGGTMTGDLVMTHQNIPSVQSYISASQYMNSLPNNGGALTTIAPLFRNVVTNGSTFVGAVPNGTGTESGFYAKSGSKWGAIKVTSTGLEVLTGDTTHPPSSVQLKFGPMTCASNSGTASFSGTISAKGVHGYQGTSGGAPGNATNLFWTGTAMQLWVDALNLGNVTITSDYRIKRDIRTMEQPALERIAALRPVLYKYADNEQFNHKAEDREREGFIAHELAEVIPSAVEGEKDAPNQIQSLRIDALVAVLVKAVQEQQEQINELRALVGK